MHANQVKTCIDKSAKKTPASPYLLSNTYCPVTHIIDVTRVEDCRGTEGPGKGSLGEAVAREELLGPGLEVLVQEVIAAMTTDP